MFIKKIFIGLLTKIVVKTARHTKYKSIQPNFIILHSNEYTQGLHYY